KADLDVQSAEDRVGLLAARFDVRRAELDNLADRELVSANEYAKNQLALDQAKHRLDQIAADSKTRVDTNRAALALVEEKQAKAWPDALAASPLTAKVTAIAGLASSDFFDLTGPVRQFDVTLRLDRADPRLRPGTSVRVLLAGRRIESVLQVPLQAVRLKNG